MSGVIKKTKLLFAVASLMGVTLSAQAMEIESPAVSWAATVGLDAQGTAKLNRKVESQIASCMSTQSLTYVTETPLITPFFQSDRKKFVAKYGYGVSTLVDLAEINSRPNVSYVRTLDASARYTYFSTLAGFDPTSEPPPLPGLTFLPGSCIAQALTSVFGNLFQMQNLYTKVKKMYDQADADPVAAKAISAWSLCMKKGGYSFATDREAIRSIRTRLDNEVFGGVKSYGIGFPEVRVGDKKNLEKLQKSELKQAQQDWKCSVKTLGPRSAIEAQLQQALLVDNAAGFANLRKATAD